MSLPVMSLLVDFRDVINDVTSDNPNFRNVFSGRGNIYIFFENLFFEFFFRNFFRIFFFNSNIEYLTF